MRADDRIPGSKPFSLSRLTSPSFHKRFYCASKGAFEGMRKALAIDLAPYRIRSNTLASTLIETDLTSPFFKDESFKRDVLGRIKWGPDRVEDLMGAAIYLASDASAMMSGTSMVIDGGWTAE